MRTQKFIRRIDAELNALLVREDWTDEKYGLRLEELFARKELATVPSKKTEFAKAIRAAKKACRINSRMPVLAPWDPKYAN